MITLKVTGMTCGHCEKSVEKALSDVDGVTKVLKVSRADEEVVVDGEADPKALIQVIEEEGYSANVA